MYQELVNSPSPLNEKPVALGKTNVRLRNAVYINRSGLTTPLINFLKDELNFANTDFFVKKKMGKNTWGTERYFKMIEETEVDIIIPRGFIGKLIRFFRENRALLIWYSFLEVILLKAKRLYLQNLYLFNNAAERSKDIFMLFIF